MTVTETSRGQDSGANTTSKLRRVYVVQYSPEPILTEDRRHVRHQAAPFLKKGVRAP